MQEQVVDLQEQVVDLQEQVAELHLVRAGLLSDEESVYIASDEELSE
eukprot:COSAG06_NODE_433_length_15843_cov_10.266768_20_plen_47_part_00